MAMDKKKVAGMLVAKLAAKQGPKPEEKKAEPEAEESDEEFARKDGASQLIKAIEAKDAAGVLSAIKAIIALCKEGE